MTEIVLAENFHAVTQNARRTGRRVVLTAPCTHMGRPAYAVTFEAN